MRQNTICIKQKLIFSTLISVTPEMATATIDVYLKFPNGKAVERQYLPSDYVSKITDQLAKEEGLPEPRVRLKYQGKIVDKTKTIGYLGICAETILKVEVLVPKEWNIRVALPAGSDQEIITVPVMSTDTIQQMKEKIAELSKIPFYKQMLKLTRGGVSLSGGPEHKTLICDVGIANDSSLTLSVMSMGESPSVSTEKNEEENDSTTQEIQQGLLSSFDSAGRNVEVVFCFDTTGSMYSCLDQVRRKLRETCERLLRDIPNIRIGIMAHGDYCDYSTYVVRYVDLTSQTDILVNFARTVPKTSGGDSPECYEWALRKAQQLDWSEESAKAFVMIGDCLPHPPSYTDQNVHWMTELDVLTGMGVKVYGVQAYPNAEARPFYEELAASSGGYHLQLNNFDLITDMFLAVCYREAAPEQLDAFVEEVTNEGRMTADTKVFLDKLEEEKPAKTEEQTTKNTTDRQNKYIHAAWWDPQLDTIATPSYTYDTETDKWLPYQRATSLHNISDTPVRTPTTEIISRKPATVTKKHRLKKFFCMTS